MTDLDQLRPAPAPAPGAAAPAAAPAAEGGASTGWRALVVLLSGVFMASMDVSIVNVAAPAVEADLGVSSAALQLVVSGYTVAYAALLITGARLGDARGHRRLFLGGLAGFTAASLACGLAATPALLVAARVAQGAAAAMMVPQVITVIHLTSTGARRAQALALWATVVSAGAVTGQVGGGALVEADLLGSGWRPVFLVNVPVGLALLVVGRRALPRTGGTGDRRLDLGGVALLISAVLALVVPLVFGPDAGWAPWTWALLAAAPPLVALLLAHLARRRRRGLDPLLDTALLRRRPVRWGLLAVCCQMVAYGGFLFTTSLHLQLGLGRSPLHAGLVFAPYAVGFAVGSLGTPRLAPRRVRLAPTAGLVVLAATYGAIGLAGRDGTWPEPLLPLLLALAGLGFGAGYSPVISRTVGHVPPANAHDASGLVNTGVQLSFAFGVALLGGAFLREGGGEGAGASGGAFAWSLLACGACALVAAALASAQLAAGGRAPGRRAPGREAAQGRGSRRRPIPG